MRTYLTRSPVMSPLATVLAVIGGLALLLAIIWSMAGNPFTPAPRDLAAYDAAVTRFVPDKIQSPVPLKFSSLAYTAVTYHGNLGLVGGWVDVSTGAGTTQRKEFICRMRWDEGKKRWLHVGSDVFLSPIHLSRRAARGVD